MSTPSRCAFVALLTLAACGSTPPPAPAVTDTPAADVTEAPAPLAVTFEPQEGWEAEEPANKMRKAQFRLPGANPDEDANLVVFHFGGTGGGIDANMQRWIAQFTQPDGSASADVAQIEESEVNGLTAHLLSVTGNYIAETSPGSGERVDKENYRLLAAIVVGASGEWFVKLVGPAPTVDRWRESFLAYVNSARE